MQQTLCEYLFISHSHNFRPKNSTSPTTNMSFAATRSSSFALTSSRVVDLTGSKNAGLVSLNAPAGLKSFPTASDKRVVLNDPESYPCIEIPSCLDLENPDFQYHQDVRQNYERLLAEGFKYLDSVFVTRNHHLQPENFQMLSSKNQRILKMSLTELFITIPEFNDVLDFLKDCEADIAIWMEFQKNHQSIKHIVDEEDDHAAEFESDAGVCDKCSPNDEEPNDDEAEKIADSGLEQVADDVVVVVEEEAVVTFRMLKEIGALMLAFVVWNLFF